MTYLYLMKTLLGLVVRLNPWFPIQGDTIPSPPGIFGNVWRQFYLSQLAALLEPSEWEPGMLLSHPQRTDSPLPLPPPRGMTPIPGLEEHWARPVGVSLFYLLHVQHKRRVWKICNNQGGWFWKT